MAMNRQTKRMLQRQGQLGPDGEPAAKQRQRPQQQQREERTGPVQFLREVRGELRKVAWPTRSEVINYSIIVFITVMVLMGFIALLDFVFGDFILRLVEA